MFHIAGSQLLGGLDRTFNRSVNNSEFEYGTDVNPINKLNRFTWPVKFNMSTTDQIRVIVKEFVTKGDKCIIITDRILLL